MKEESLRGGGRRTLLEFIPEAVAVVSRKGRVVYINSVFARRFQVREEEALGKEISDILPGATAAVVKEHLSLLSPGKAAHSFWVGSETARKRVQMAGVEIDGRLMGALIMLGESTGESVVRQQSLELFRTMVEDLEMPTAEIRSSLNSSRELNPSLQNSLERQTRQMEESLARLRDFGEVLFGVLRREQVPFYPGRLIALARKSLQPLAQERGVFLEDGSGRELPRLVGDAALFTRVLGLVVDYMIRTVSPGEMVIIAPDLLLRENGEPRLTCAVSGTGVVTLDPELLRRELSLSDLLSAGTDERKRLILRLFFARRLAAAMGGEFTLAAHEAVGTTIGVEAPVQIHFRT